MMDAEGSRALARRLSLGLEPGHAVRFTTAGDGYDAGDEGVVEALDDDAGLVLVATPCGRSVQVPPSIVRPSA